MSDAESFARVWFNRTALAETDTPTMHESAACATRGRDDQAVPSFRALAEDVDAEDCQVCIDRYNQAETTWTADAVRGLRDERDWTQADLADALGCSPSTVANWETGYGQPGHEMVAALDALAGADPEPTDTDWDAPEPAIRWVYECEHCGETFVNERSHRGHQAQCPGGNCETCIETTDRLAYCVHRLEAHETPQSRLGDLEPGGFEAAVERAETIPDLADALGFSTQRTIRLLHIYDLADAVGVREDDGPVDDDPGWVEGAPADAPSWADVNGGEGA